MDTKPLRSFLEIPYVDLETMNLSAKKKRKDNISEKELKEAETMARSMSNEWLKIIIKRNEVSFVMKDCLPNKLNVSMHALKNLFTDKASIIVLMLKRNSF